MNFFWVALLRGRDSSRERGEAPNPGQILPQSHAIYSRHKPVKSVAGFREGLNWTETLFNWSNGRCHLAVSLVRASSLHLGLRQGGKARKHEGAQGRQGGQGLTQVDDESQ